MARTIGVVSLAALLIALVPATAVAQSKPSPGNPSEPQRPALIVESASISSVSPDPLRVGARFSVTVKIATLGSVTGDQLRKILQVHINAVPATLSDAAASAQDMLLPNPTEITLFGDVPAGIVDGYSESNVPTATLSVVSTLEGRQIASAPAKVAPQRDAATAYDRALAIVTSPWLYAAWLLIAIPIGLYLRQRRIAALRISELEAAVQLERHRLNTLATAESKAPEIVGPEHVTLPDDVIAALKSGELVIVTGASASVVAGLPSSRALWLGVLDEVADAIPAGSREQLQSMIAGDLETVVEPLLSYVGRERLVKTLTKLLSTPSAPSRLHHLFAQLPVQVFIDLNWDNLMHEALPKASLLVPKRSEAASQSLRAGQLSLIKPFGELREHETVALTYREMRRILSQSPDLERSLATLFAQRTLLFVGVSLKGLEAILSNLAPELEGGGQRHFALVPADAGNDIWEAGLGRRYGVRLVPYRPTPDHSELVSAIETLGASVVETASESPTARAERQASMAARLTHVDLTAIGVFRSLHIDFTPGWTLLLGDNGGGKSTILKSIAFALAGNDERTAAPAARLLRTGFNEGSIAVGLGSTRLVSTLMRDGPAVRVRAPQITPLQGGQVLVLAFPALRGVSMKSPSGPRPIPAADPSVSDIAPLLEGGVDSRLDNLKQWVVNIVLRAEADPQGRDAQMLKTFSKLIADMVPGGGFKFGRVDRKNFQVLLETQHGEVPFDAVSQGMSAILNWIGILLQRLYDVHGKHAEPEKGSAILLIDEIDAHLHPKWQRQLVSLTRNHFPNVQVIASSHSPLLAGAVERSELRVVARDYATGEIRADLPLEDLAGQKAEDILVSSMFALPTTRSVEAEETIRRYFELRQKDELHGKERSEFGTLKAKFEALNYGPTIAQKEQLDQLESQLSAELSHMPPDAIKAVNQLLQGRKSGDA